jgi:hypothetical protein
MSISPKAQAALEISRVMRHNNIRGTTYLISVPGAGMVKIGFTKHPNAKGRIAELQKACPFEFEVLGEIPGGRELEQCLHSLFARHRVRGEWFRLVDDLAEFVDEIKALRSGGSERPAGEAT